MITYKDCPECGANKIHSSVRLCEVCETCDKYESKIAEALRERDEARAALEESEHQMHMRIRSGYDKTIADCWRAKVAEVEAERDEALAQVARREREHAALLETAQKALAYVEAERDLLKNHYSPEAAAKLRAELASARAEIEMLRGDGCREAKEGEPESGPCGVCLKCAEERGAKWALDSVGWSHKDDRWSIAERVCRDARSK